MLEYIRLNPAIISFFRKVLLPEEHLFHTILFNANEQQRGKIEEVCLTYVHWDRAPELYHIPLGMNDLGALRNSRKFFARKFDASYDSEILDRLDGL